jgi:hypothetical protein
MIYRETAAGWRRMSESHAAHLSAMSAMRRLRRMMVLQTQKRTKTLVERPLSLEAFRASLSQFLHGFDQFDQKRRERAKSVDRFMYVGAFWKGVAEQFVRLTGRPTR